MLRFIDPLELDESSALQSISDGLLIHKEEPDRQMTEGDLELAQLNEMLRTLYEQLPIAEKVSVLKTEAYFRGRRERGDLTDFDTWLAASSDQESEAGDPRRRVGTDWERRLSAGFARRGLDAPGARPAALEAGDGPQYAAGQPAPDVRSY